ncbi:hypothetical protein [uncultured Legionella sp.]|uniref:hypothetical protein n=1 Tax=uncultured Legionella sp. TaxID=210934 RepID=UPI002610A1BD|nr:hypothetical protein [uncultured Legionella sp.]
MTKFLCVDFDGTLSDAKLASLIKIISDDLKRTDSSDVKIGIVTSRSIYDDFKTAGQFYDEIVDVLEKNDIKLDFICTRFCLHQINSLAYEELSISETINNAKKIPVFGDVVSDYLVYRAENSHDITLIRERASRDLIQALQAKVDSQIQFELQVHADHIKGKMAAESTPKVRQIETVIASYNVVPEDAEVLLLDDDPKHIRAIQSCNNPDWHAVTYAGLVSEVKTELMNFLGVKQPAHTAVIAQPHEKGLFQRFCLLFSKSGKTQVQEDTGSEIKEEKGLNF